MHNVPGDLTKTADNARRTTHSRAEPNSNVFFAPFQSLEHNRPPGPQNSSHPPLVRASTGTGAEGYSKRP